MKLEINWSYDEHDCETCGSSWSEGAVVTLDGTEILNKPANAHCLSNTYVTREDIFEAALKHLGVEIIENLLEV